MGRRVHRCFGKQLADVGHAPLAQHHSRQRQPIVVNGLLRAAGGPHQHRAAAVASGGSRCRAATISAAASCGGERLVVLLHKRRVLGERRALLGGRNGAETAVRLGRAEGADAVAEVPRADRSLERHRLDTRVRVGGIEDMQHQRLEGCQRGRLHLNALGRHRRDRVAEQGNNRVGVVDGAAVQRVRARQEARCFEEGGGERVAHPRLRGRGEHNLIREVGALGAGES